MHGHFSFSDSTCPQLVLAGTLLEYTSKHKYLGLVLTPTLSWSAHVNTIVSSANTSLGYIRRNFRSAPTNFKRLLYITLIRPKLEYASAIWRPSQATLTNLIEATQRRAVRFIMSD